MKPSKKIPALLSGLLFSLIFSAAAFGPALYAQSNPGPESDSGKYLMMFEYLFRYVQDHYVDEVSPETLYEGAVKGLFESLDDPYSVYLTATDMEDFSDTTTGEFGGVGLYISKQPLDSLQEPPESSDPHATFRSRYAPFVEVISPIEGTPAYRAGISAGDFIIAIDDESTGDLTMDEVLARLRGEPGKPVTIKIARRGNLVFNVTLVREIIEVPTIRYALMPGNIGYIKIVKWTPYTDDRVSEALEDLKSQNFTSLILDVRGNPGGLLSSVVDTADLFLNRGTIVSTRSRIAEENEVFYAKRRTAVPMDMPIVLLINKGSASASEIMAGALKDTFRAVLLGDTTFGKGSVQQVRAFGDGGFKITTARYYTPNGVNIDKVGIDPNRFVPAEEFSDEDLVHLQKLYENNRIPYFVEEHPAADPGEIRRFITQLKGEGIALEDRVLEKLIREEYNRNLNDPPVYDLEYDTALQQASEILRTNGTQAILNSRQ